MAIHGLGSFSEPIVISDEEDAALVESELNRWNDSPSSSTSHSPSVRDVPLTGKTIVHAWSMQASAPPSQKRKRQGSEANNGEASSSSMTEGAAKRVKKQKDRTEHSHPPKPSFASPSTYGAHDSIGSPWMDTWPRSDIGHPWPVSSSTSNRHSVLSPIDTSPATSMSRPWPTPRSRRSSTNLDVNAPPFYPLEGLSWGVPIGDAAYCPPPSPPRRSHASPSYAAHGTSSRDIRPPRSEVPSRPISSALDDSLRRLEALSASLLAVSAKAPAPTKGSAPIPIGDDRRRIGKYEDRSDFGLFDFTAVAHADPSSTDLPIPHVTRTIVLAHLPKKFRVRTFVEAWARRFGTFLRLELDVKAGKALVEYSSPSAADAAFSSLKLRGGGKEHIRAYWFRGPSTSPSVTPTVPAAAEVEEGEIEEGEVVEVAPPSKAKKKKKAKKKAQGLEDRITDPGMPSSSSHQTILSTSSSTPSIASAEAPRPPGHVHRPSLEERFSDVPVAIDEVWEEEMDLASEDDYPLETSVVLSPQLVATTILSQSDDGMLEDWEADMDVEVLSEVGLRSPRIALGGEISSPTIPIKRPRSPSADDLEEHRPNPIKGVLEVRRKELEASLVKSKSELASRPTTSVASNTSGTSATPEPATPSDLSTGIDVAFEVVGHVESIVGVGVKEPVAIVPPAIKQKDSGMNFDDLAESLIKESIRAVAPRPAPPAPSSIPSLPPRPVSVSLLAPSLPPKPVSLASSLVMSSVPVVPLVSPAPAAPTTPQGSQAAQLLAKKQRLEDYITASKRLLAQISAAKTKMEKDSLMRQFKEKQRAMDLELKGNAATSSAPTPSPTPPLKVARWPETPRELIIDISDDEAC
ncbi:hypothetical protein GY45DRAFT_557142 [Cubamyces sp. BRFM 1775]|nr:hypothetical protein GY45DRAFT_557142 [Cubamyces sp. BRFM 1775]